MSVEALAMISGTPVAPLSTAPTAVQAGPGEGFVRWMTDEAGEVNSRIVGAEESLRQLATGQSNNLHQVMLDLERAKLSFELALQVRNRLLEGYQEIMRMQI